MSVSTLKIERFVLDYFEDRNKNNDIKKNKYLYDILMNCSYYSENNILDKIKINQYFTNEQLVEIKTKQKELGYEDNFNRFVRYAMFDFFVKKHNIVIPNEFFGELIDFDKFKLLCNKCKDDLLNGRYTSYDLDLLRDNKKYESKISFFEFDCKTKEIDFNIDFLEYDMLIFLEFCFRHGKVYSDLIDLSTQQSASTGFMKMEDGSSLEKFTDYDNIVPNTDSFYYLFLYYTVVLDPGELDIDEIFNETDEHIDLLLKKYSFGKIVKHFKEKHNIINTYNIFNKKCIENLLLNNIITTDDIVEAENVVESNDIIESNKIIESNENIELENIIESNEIIELDENIDTK